MPSSPTEVIISDEYQVVEFRAQMTADGFTNRETGPVSSGHFPVLTDQSPDGDPPDVARHRAMVYADTCSRSVLGTVTYRVRRVQVYTVEW
jgi:hypothetical protein